MNKEQAKKLLDTYGKAWEDRDADLILTIFASDATYLDPAEGEVKGHDGIKRYWQEKVIACQREIHFKLKNVWIDEGGATVIAEWDAELIDTVRNLHIDMTEVAIFGVKDGKFSSLREYYKTVKRPI